MATETEILQDQIITGPLFNEPMRVVIVRPNGPDSVEAGLEGLETSNFRRVTLTSSDIASLKITEPHPTFEGDGNLLRLGLQAYSMGIAHEFDPYFGLSISRVDPLPHQLEAVYEYFMKLPSVRFLLADDAGAGKTIMAGLLVRELKLRGLAERILVVCPSNLTFQWQRELFEKFDQSFQVLRGSNIRDQFGMNQWLDQWRRWCSNNNVDPMEATPADLCDYLQWKSTRVGYKRLRGSVTGISKMYEAGTSPTDAEEVMALLAEIKKQKAAEKQTGKKDTEKPPGQGDITLEAPEIEALLSSSVPPGLDEDDLARIKKAYVARLSSSTHKKYRGSWESYQKWCNDRGVPAEGAEPLHVAAYICQLAQGLDVATVSDHLSAIRYRYRSLRPYDNPAMYPIVSDTLTGLRRQDPHPPDQMDPIGELGYAVIVQRAQEPRSGGKTEQGHPARRHRHCGGWADARCPATT